MNPRSGKRARENQPCHQGIRQRQMAVCLSLAMLLGIGGCAGSRPQHSEPTLGSPSARSDALPATDRAMFDNLVTIVAQVFEPLNTTLQINRDDTDPRMQYFVDSLAQQGFGIQRVSADQGANYLDYTHQLNPDSGDVQLSVSVGAVTISRDYSLDSRERKVSPVSVVRLSGTRMPVVVEDTENRYFRSEDPAMSDASYVASLALDEASPIISLITPEVVSGVSRQATGGPSLQGLNSSQVEVNNLFYGNESTFASVLDNYRRVDRQIIIFGNDSMVLGDTNKQLIEQFVDTKMRDNDVISLVGCSNGPTALAIGNEGLALGRAQRVTQALMARGVARERVLDEGCWAPTNVGDRFPSRGVVMELWRSRT